MRKNSPPSVMLLWFLLSFRECCTILYRTRATGAGHPGNLTSYRVRRIILKKRIRAIYHECYGNADGRLGKTILYKDMEERFITRMKQAQFGAV